jgi:hypothetical protein
MFNSTNSFFSVSLHRYIAMFSHELKILKASVLNITFLFMLLPAFGQKDSFDLTLHVAPPGWKKEVRKNVVIFSTINKKDQTWCQIALYRSVLSKGSIQEDFMSAWQELIAVPYKTTENPKGDSAVEVDGWKIRSGGAAIVFNKANAIALLTAFTGYNRTVDIVAATNAQRYLQAIETFTGSIELKKPSSNNSIAIPNKPLAVNNAGVGNFTFTVTNFDDGWASTAEENWVKVSKGNIKVLIHHPDPKTDAYNSVLKDADYNAWKILIAPRYRNLENFEWLTVQSWQSITFLQADAIDIASGNKVHVILFKRHLSNGSGRYLEFVTRSKSEYENEFGAYHNTEFDWDKPANMQYRNKFAVAAADLTGTWTASDYASLRYYYSNTGGYAGATATSTALMFNFFADNRYESEQAGADGFVGNQKFFRQTYKGSMVVNNWTITLTNRFKGESETYNCQFEATKQGRILLLTDRLNTTYSLVRK